jgi:hypothetical protein
MRRRALRRRAFILLIGRAAASSRRNQPRLLVCEFGRPAPDFAIWESELPLLARSLLALVIRGGQSQPDQTPEGVGTGWMIGLPAAPFINVLLPLQIKPKTHDRGLPNARTTAFFSYYNV